MSCNLTIKNTQHIFDIAIFCTILSIMTSELCWIQYIQTYLLICWFQLYQTYTAIFNIVHLLHIQQESIVKITERCWLRTSKSWRGGRRGSRGVSRRRWWGGERSKVSPPTWAGEAVTTRSAEVQVSRDEVRAGERTGLSNPNGGSDLFLPLSVLQELWNFFL